VNTASGARSFDDSYADNGCRQHDALRRERAHERVADVAGMDFAVDVRLADASRDQLRDLRAEIENEDPVVHRVSVVQSAR